MKSFLRILRCFFWSPEGATGEGNEQWFYTISIAIQTIFLWTIAPAIALTFTILWASHLVLMYIFGEFVEDNTIPAACWLIINIGLVIIGLVNSWIFTLASVLISVFFYNWGDIIVDRVCLKDNPSFFSKLRKHHIDPTFWTSILLYAAFVYVTCAAPFIWWVKLIIILGLTLLHPVIDDFVGECLCIGDVFWFSVERIYRPIRDALRKGKK